MFAVIEVVAAAAVAGCVRPPAMTEPEHAASSPSTRVEASEPGTCTRYLGDPVDPDLQGQTRTHPVRCCTSQFGFDPELARASCGFAEYLGESEELACVHRFRGTDGGVHELRLTALLDRSLTDAVGLHERGEFGPEHLPASVSVDAGLAWSSAGSRRWAFVGRSGDEVHRLAWDASACTSEQMLPVVDAMATPAASARADEPTVALPRADEAPTRAPESAESSGPTLLDALAPSSRDRYPLPRAGAALVGDLLLAVRSDDVDQFARLLTADARLGLPDRRELGSRAVAKLGLQPSVERIRAGASRFAATAPIHCPNIDRRVRPEVARGRQPMWCLVVSDDGLDVLAFGLRGHLDDAQPDGRVAYIGVFPARPLAPLSVPGEPPPPPIVPIPELVCTDPHARSSYPDRCPSGPDDAVAGDEGVDDGADEGDDDPPVAVSPR